MYKRLILLLAAAFMALVGVNAMALGLGGYMTVGGGNATFDVSKFEYYVSRNLTDSSNLAVGGGFVLDTNCARNALFNYRLKIGGERDWVDRESEMKLSRLHLQNVFGFGVVRSKYVRFWLGPAVGANYTWGKRDSEEYDIFIAMPNFPFRQVFLGTPLPVILLGIGRDKINKIYYGGIDFGFVLGLNINVGDYVTFGPELGFKYAFNWGSQDREVYAGLPLSVAALVPINTGESKKDLSMNGWEIYMNFSVMFRVGGDKYGG